MWLLEWLERSWLGETVRTTPWVYPALEVVHLVGLALLVGTAAAFDLRLLGIGRRLLPVSAAAGLLLRPARAGFVVTAFSGVALFASSAPSVAGSGATPVKFALIILAGANIAAFHLGIYRSVERWDTAVRTPPRARLAAVVSLAVWSGVVACGRLIAYT